MDIKSFDVTDSILRVIFDSGLASHPTSSVTLHPSNFDGSSDKLTTSLINILSSNISPDWLKFLCLFHLSHGQHLSRDNTVLAGTILSVTLSSPASPKLLPAFNSYKLSILALLNLVAIQEESELQLQVFIKKICDELLVVFNQPSTITESHIHLLKSLCNLLMRLPNRMRYLLLDFASLALTTISKNVKMVVKNHTHIYVIQFMSLMWIASVTILSCTANLDNNDSNNPPHTYNCTIGEFTGCGGESSLAANTAVILSLIAPVGEVGLLVSPLNRTFKASRLWTSICFYNLVILLKQFPSWFTPTSAYKLILRFMHRFLLAPVTTALPSIHETEAHEVSEEVAEDKIVMLSEHAQTLRVMGIALWSVFQQVITDYKTTSFLQDISVSVPALLQHQSAVTSRATSPSISRTVAVVGGTQATAAANTVKITVIDLLQSVDGLVQTAVENDTISDAYVLERLLLSIHLRASFKLSQAFSNNFLLPPTTQSNKVHATYLYSEDDIEDLRYQDEQSSEHHLKQQLDGGLFKLRHIFHNDEFITTASSAAAPFKHQPEDHDLQVEAEQWMSRWEAFCKILSTPQAVSWLEIYNDHQLADACVSMAIHWQLLLLQRTHALFHVILHESVMNHQRQLAHDDFVGSSVPAPHAAAAAALTQWYQSTQLESLATLPSDQDNHIPVVQQVFLNSSSPLAIDLVKKFLTFIIRFMSRSLPLIRYLFTLQHITAAEGIMKLQEHILASFWWLLHRTTGFAVDFIHTEDLLQCCDLSFQSMPETTLGAIFALTLQHVTVTKDREGESMHLLKEAVHRCINSMTEQAVLPGMFEKIAAIITATHPRTQSLPDHTHDTLPYMLQIVSLKATEPVVVNENVLDFLAYFIKLAMKRLSLMDAPSASEQMSVDVMQSMTFGLCDMMHCVLLFMLQPCQIQQSGSCSHVLHTMIDHQYASESLDGLWQLWIRLDDIYQGLLQQYSISSDVDDGDDCEGIDVHQAKCFPITTSTHFIAFHLYDFNTSSENRKSLIGELHAQILLLWERLLGIVKHFITLRPNAYLALKLRSFLLKCLKARFVTFLCLFDESNVGEYLEFMLAIISVVIGSETQPEITIKEISVGDVLSDSQLQVLICSLLLTMLPVLKSHHQESAKQLSIAINKLLQPLAGTDESGVKAILVQVSQNLLHILPQSTHTLLARFETGWEVYNQLNSRPVSTVAAQQQHVVDLTISNSNSQQVSANVQPSRVRPVPSTRAAINEEEAISFDFYAVPDTTGPISGNTKDGDETYASLNAMHHEKEMSNAENISSVSMLMQPPLQQPQSDNRNMENGNDNNCHVSSQDEAVEGPQRQDQTESQAQQHQPSMPSPIMPNSQQTRHSMSSVKRTRPSPLLSTSRDGPPFTTARKRRRLVGSEYESIEELLLTTTNKLQQSRHGGGIADEDGKEALLLEALQDSHTLSAAILDLIIQQRSYPQHMQKMADDEEEIAGEIIS